MLHGYVTCTTHVARLEELNTGVKHARRRDRTRLSVTGSSIVGPHWTGFDRYTPPDGGNNCTSGLDGSGAAPEVHSGRTTGAGMGVCVRERHASPATATLGGVQ